MTVTIRDVAAAAGVSTATVSRALHDDTAVASGTRNRVREAAARLAYRPSPVAARLRTRRHGVVAVVAPADLSGSTPYVLTGAVAVLSKHGVDCALHLIEPGTLDVGTRLHELEGRVDAALLLGDWATSRPDENRVPIVAVRAEPAGATCVWLDEELAADQVALHLDATGYRRAAVLVDATPSGSRVAASHHAAAVRRRRPVPVLRRIPPDRSQPGRTERATAALLTTPHPPDALVCTTERLLRAAHRALLQRGLRPGPDIGVIGYGTVETAVELAVTTLVEPHRELGSLAALVALRLVGVAAADQVEPVPAPQLIIGASTRRAWPRARTR